MLVGIEMVQPLGIIILWALKKLNGELPYGMRNFTYIYKELQAALSTIVERYKQPNC